MKFSLRDVLIAAILCGSCGTFFGQAIGPTVEVPTDHPSVVADAHADDSLTLAGEYKSTKNVVEQEKPVCLYWYSEIGYMSEYNFRGTNLAPDSDGVGFADAEVSKWGFTLGAYGIHQFGTARAPSRAIGEGGGAGVQQTGSLGPAFPMTIQHRFNEVDVFLQYHHDFGPVDVAFGNIAFFIDRRAETFVAYPEHAAKIGANGDVWGPFRTVLNETYDRFFIRLATSVIPHLQPSVTYYQTVHSTGTDPFHHVAPNVTDPTVPGVRYDGYLRSAEDYGGYLQGKLRGDFRIADRITFNPYGIVSYSFRDRSVPVEHPTNDEDYLRGRPLTGFNHAEIGLEVPILLFHWAGVSTGPCAPPDPRLRVVPFGAYSYHISKPTAGTDRDESWGGVKLALSF